jgi:catechol 2,3-dioxygenase-like lactoylglutathione lyase family enzyme
MDPRISIVTLGVEDLATSTAFYRDGLELPEREWDGRIAFFELAGTWLALYPWDALADDAGVPADGRGFRGITLAHNVESKSAVDTVLAEAESAGATIVKPARDTDWGGYSGYFSDPDDHLWEVAWAPDFSIEE